MKPIVLLDVDGVSADIGRFAREIFQYLGFSHLYDPNAWDFGTSALPTKREQDAFWATFGEPGGCLHIRPCVGARSFVNQLRRLAHVRFVTSPFHTSATWMHERQKWLQEHMDADVQEIMHIKDKSIVYGDVFVDDYMPHVDAWASRWKDGKAVLFDQPYNQAAVLPRNAYRVRDYEEILKLVAA